VSKWIAAIRLVALLAILLHGALVRGQSPSAAARGPGRTVDEPTLPPVATPRSAEDALAAAPMVTRSQSPDEIVPDEETRETPEPENRRLVRRNAQSPTGEEASRGQVELLKGLDTSQLKTMGSALAVVIGLLLVSLWLVKRAGPRGVQIAPSEVARVIGRIPVGAKQQAQLLHLGNKILLVATTPTGAETLGEIDDPSEVQRIVALCQRSDASSAQAAFEDVFRGFGKDNARGFLDDDDSGSSKGGRR
jgi:flagellar biogenesis protein FliO